jgi:hypothetical protein
LLINVTRLICFYSGFWFLEYIQVFENEMLKKIFGSQKNEWKKSAI